MPLFRPRSLCLALIPLYSTTWMAAAQAQDTSQDIGETQTLAPVVVTGTKRGETLEQFNGAASVADRLDLDDAQVTSTLELDRVFPEWPAAQIQRRMVSVGLSELTSLDA